MTATDIGASVVDRAKAKVAAVEAKGLSYVPQIIEAHKQVVAAERSGHQRSLDAAIAAGKLLNDAKDAIKGQFKWGDWRSEHLNKIPQTTASLYMRLAKNEGKLTKPDPATDDGRKIATGVATLAAEGKLSIRNVAALLTTRTRPSTPRPKRTDEDKAKEYLKLLAVDELVIVLKSVHDAEYLKSLADALRPAAIADGASLRRV